MTRANRLDEDGEGPRHWKTAPLVAWAAGRPFVWLDEEITAADRTWVAAHHPGRALLHRVAADRGLTARDFALVADWVDKLQVVGC